MCRCISMGRECIVSNRLSGMLAVINCEIDSSMLELGLPLRPNWVPKISLFRNGSWVV